MNYEHLETSFTAVTGDKPILDKLKEDKPKKSKTVFIIQKRTIKFKMTTLKSARFLHKVKEKLLTKYINSTTELLMDGRKISLQQLEEKSILLHSARRSCEDAEAVLGELLIEEELEEELEIVLESFTDLIMKVEQLEINLIQAVKKQQAKVEEDYGSPDKPKVEDENKSHDKQKDV